MNIKRSIFIIILLLCATAVSFGLPKPRYKSPEIISKLDIPYRIFGWNGKDISQKLNLNDLRFNFISEIFIRSYINKYGENLILLILDAGNFHNPKVCLGGSGYTARDLPDTEFRINNRAFKAHTVYFEKGKEGIVVIYWICINKKVVDWTRQKIIQLWYSLFNKEKIGLMVRLEVSASPTGTESAVKTAQRFISEISSKIPAEQAEYIFGK